MGQEEAARVLGVSGWQILRRDGIGFIDVELPRGACAELRERLRLAPGRLLHLKPQQITRFQA